MTRRLALVTGGTSGIGLAIAQSLAVDHDLALAYASNRERAEEARAMLTGAGATAHFFSGRLTDFADAERLVKAVEEETGRLPTVLVCSAGSLRDGLFSNSDFEDQVDLIGEHLIVPMALARLLIGGMYRDRFGRIVLLGSISARYAKRGQCAYAAAKAGLEGFAKTLAMEVAHRGVTVNVIAPGLIDTPMTRELLEAWREKGVRARKKIPVGYPGKAQDVAGYAKFLCSDEARYITGSVQVIDGGRSLGDPSQ